MNQDTARRSLFGIVGKVAVVFVGGLLVGCALLVCLYFVLNALDNRPKVWREKRAHTVVRSILAGTMTPDSKGAISLSAQDAYLASRGTVYVTRTPRAGVCVFFPEGSLETSVITGWGYCTGNMPATTSTWLFSPNGYHNFVCTDVIDKNWVYFRLSD